VLGALVLMPLMLGMSQMVFVIGGDQWLSLMGHIIYGLVTAFLLIPLRNRA
jgi:Na+(H+)/acetate symporter ActP